ncbi:MAG: hypothetical protein JW797_14940 [Bradymonadales bacterium]|nr:hypothetical protein [Bradymonadales bacterium]
MPEHSPRQVLAVFILLSCLATGPGQTLAQGTGGQLSPGPVEVTPTPVVVEPIQFQPIQLEEVERIEQVVASPQTLSRYQVSEEMARQVARGHVLSQGYLSEPLTECLYLPKQDIEGHVIGHFFLFSSVAECSRYEVLADIAQQVSELARAEMSMSTARSAWQLRAHELTAEQFYSVTISGYQFRPPLELGHRGLPLFLMDLASLPEGCEDGPHPEVIFLAHRDSLYEAVLYQCNQGPVLYSHYAGRVMGLEEALFTDIETTLAEWRQMVLDPWGPGTAGLEELNQRWLVNFEAGSLQQGR